ncbi:MAG: hypothetical protein ABIJ24_02590 [Nitrospinota bacterium]
MAGAKTTAAIAEEPMARIDDKAGRVKGQSTTARFMQLSARLKDLEIKKVVKRDPHSSYFIDRRKPA